MSTANWTVVIIYSCRYVAPKHLWICGKGLKVDSVPLWLLFHNNIIELRRTEAKIPSSRFSQQRCALNPLIHAKKHHGCMNHSLVTLSWLTTWWQLNSFITEASFKNSILSRMLADSLTVLMATLVSGSSFTTPLAIPSYTIPKEPCPSSRHMVIFSRGTSHSSGTYTKERKNRPWCSTFASSVITHRFTIPTAQTVLL